MENLKMLLAVIPTCIVFAIVVGSIIMGIEEKN